MNAMMNGPISVYIVQMFLLCFSSVAHFVKSDYAEAIRADMPKCCDRKLLSCTLAVEALREYTANGISWSGMVDENATHNGWYLVIDTHGKVTISAVIKQKHDTGWFGYQRDFQRVELIAKQQPLLRNIIIPLNRQDAPVSRLDGKSDPRPKISFCGLPLFQDILWPSSQFQRGNIINADDYNIDEAKWMSKTNKAWFRGSLNGFKKGRVSIVNETLSFPHLVDAGIVNSVQCRVEPTDRLCLPGIMKPEMPLHEAVQKYRYIIDIDGHCSAMRLQEVLGRNVAVIKVRSDERQWYSSRLIPWVHYIPITLKPFRINPTVLYNSIKRNQTIPQHSSTREAIEWAQKHPKEAFETIRNSRQFYDDYLTEEAVQCYIETILRSMLKLYRFDVSQQLELFKFPKVWGDRAGYATKKNRRSAW